MGTLHQRVLIPALISIAAGASWNGPTTPWLFPQPLHFPALRNDPPNITIEEIDLGRHLFYDRRLSREGDLSCASCHMQEHAFSDRDAFSRNSMHENTRRNAMPLFNLAWYDAFGWDGRAPTLEAQVSLALKNELGIDPTEAAKRMAEDRTYRDLVRRAYGTYRVDSALIAHALAQFLRTLVSYRSKYDRVLARNDHLTPDEYAGFVLMNDQSKGDCLHCHTTDADALGTTGGFSNNGLDPFLEVSAYADLGRAEITGDAKDVVRFKIPSLRNIAITAPYMHDGRFTTLEEVLDHYSEGVHNGLNVDSRMAAGTRVGVNLSSTEKCQIIAFLHTLTDSAFITDPAFSDPFGQR